MLVILLASNIFDIDTLGWINVSNTFGGSRSQTPWHWGAIQGWPKLPRQYNFRTHTLLYIVQPLYSVQPSSPVQPSHRPLCNLNIL